MNVSDSFFFFIISLLHSPTVSILSWSVVSVWRLSWVYKKQEYTPDGTLVHHRTPFTHTYELFIATNPVMFLEGPDNCPHRQQHQLGIEPETLWGGSTTRCAIMPPLRYSRNEKTRLHTFHSEKRGRKFRPVLQKSHTHFPLLWLWAAILPVPTFNICAFLPQWLCTRKKGCKKGPFF